MNDGAEAFVRREDCTAKIASPNAGGSLNGDNRAGAAKPATNLARIPDGVRASVATRSGEYDARRLRSQREIIRDVMISAADCETWLTLGELRALTRYGEASISAQLRHLRKARHGHYRVEKRRRQSGECEAGRSTGLWEYQIVRPGLFQAAREEQRGGTDAKACD